MKEQLKTCILNIHSASNGRRTTSVVHEAPQIFPLKRKLQATSHLSWFCWILRFAELRGSKQASHAKAIFNRNKMQQISLKKLTRNSREAMLQVLKKWSWHVFFLRELDRGWLIIIIYIYIMVLVYVENNVSTYHYAYKFSLVGFFQIFWLLQHAWGRGCLNLAWEPFAPRELWFAPLPNRRVAGRWLRSVLVVDTWLEFSEVLHIFLVSFKHCKFRTIKKKMQTNMQHPHHSPFFWWGKSLKTLFFKPNTPLLLTIHGWELLRENFVFFLGQIRGVKGVKGLPELLRPRLGGRAAEASHRAPGWMGGGENEIF